MATKTRIRNERCDTCLYRLKYPQQTRRRILADVERSQGYVQCHKHEDGVVCRGFYDDLPRAEGNTWLRLTRHMAAEGKDIIELVADGQYPRCDEDEDGEE